MEIITKYVEVHIFRQLNSKLEFLLLKRSNKEIYGGLWQMVTGKIKKGEKAFESALREMKEETGLSPKKFWAAPNINSFYSSDEDCIILLPVFAALVKEDSQVIISKEHTEFQWTDSKKAKILLAWPGQRKSVEIIESYITKEPHFLDFIEIKL
jgi:dihydroneopterin triphosphate diphosphatase